MSVPEKQDESHVVSFDDETLTVSSTRVLKNAADLNESLTSQLLFLIESPHWWLDSIEDCFNKRKVDDGILLYKEMHSSSSLTLNYWLGYFGGNPRGYVLIPSSSDGYKVLIENCDSDFIWRGNDGPVPKRFIKQVKMAAYGDKYREEE